ncbi:MAG TPA: TIM barrel protein [Patescibacteria group bacterium]|nr:TIM barrel protein [Patescibacteria group bacterium]
MKRGVTLYSYTGDFQMGTMNLEQCVADVADMEAEGIEILGETHVEGYPNPSEEWVGQWHGLMEKYHTKPSCLDSFVDSMLKKGSYLTVDESIAMLVRDMKLANRLGFKIMRPTFGKSPIPVPELIEKALPYAEQYDLKVAIEIHSPARIESDWMNSLLEVISRTNTKRFGFTLDMSIFSKRPPHYFEDRMLRRGAHENIVRFVGKAYEDHLGPEKTMAEVRKMGGNEADLSWASLAGVYHFSDNPPQDLLKIMPYIYHIHGKFWEMTDDLQEYSIPYETVIPVLVKGGCGAYFSSEYEGPRELFRASDQLRRHQAMLRILFGEAKETAVGRGTGD